MTVQVSDRLSQLYVGNGVNTRFDFMFRAYEQEDETGIGVRVKVGNDFEFIEESEYAVTFNPDNMGGYVTFVDPPISETFFYIAGKTPVDQLLDITNYDNFYPDAIERALDKLTAILQEWKHLVDFETQARILADIDYDQLAIQREADLKAYIDGIASSITGQPVLGLPSKFVVDGSETQEQINGKNIRSFESIADLLTYTAKKHGQVVFVESTNSHYKYNSLDMSPISLSGWVLQHSSIISTKQIGINYGDITNLIQFAIDNDLQIEIEKDVTVASTVFNQNNVFGRGVLHYNNNPSVENDYSYLAPRSLNPYPRLTQDRTGWFDNIESRGNFENGAGYGLLVNRKDVRPQVSGFRNLSGMQAYTSTDIVGLYVDIAAQKHSTITNSTSYTNMSITSPDIVEGINVKKGDFLRTGRDAAGNSNLQWRGWVTDIDYENNTIYTAWWLSENGNVGTPTNGIVCITPDTNSIWGQNTNVYIFNDDPATKIQGFELGVYADNGKIYEALNAFFAVNLNSGSKATNAFLTSGKWGSGLRTSADNAVFAEGVNGLRWNHIAGGAAVYAQSPLPQGYLIKSDGGSTPRYTMDAFGKQSHNRQEYRVVSSSTTHTGLNPSIIIGANATGPHVTTLSTTSMTAGTVLKFKNLQALDWSIVAGSTTYVLNSSGTIDILELFYDGTNFLKMLAAKSL